MWLAYVAIVVAVMAIVYCLTTIGCMIAGIVCKVVCKVLMRWMMKDYTYENYNMSIPILPLALMCFLIAINVLIIIICVGLI